MRWPWSKPKYKVELFLSVTHEWHWRIRSLNGEVLASSEAYSDKTAARHTAISVADAIGCELVVP